MVPTCCISGSAIQRSKIIEECQLLVSVYSRHVYCQVHWVHSALYVVRALPQVTLT